MDYRDAGRQLRQRFAIQVKSCECGGVLVTLIAAEELLVCEYGYEARRPVKVPIFDSDPEGCPREWVTETLMKADHQDLQRDLVRSLQAARVTVDHDAIEAIAEAVAAMHQVLLDLFLEDYTSAN